MVGCHFILDVYNKIKLFSTILIVYCNFFDNINLLGEVFWMNNVDYSKDRGIKGYMQYLESIGEKIDPLKISRKLGKSIDEVLVAGKELGKQFTKTYAWKNGVFTIVK